MRARLLCPALRVPGGHGADRRRQGRRGGDGVEETLAHRRRRIWVAGLFHHVIRFGCVADVDATTTTTSGRSGGGLDYALCMPSTAAPGPPDAGAPREQRLPFLLLLSSPHKLARHVPSDRLYHYLGDAGIQTTLVEEDEEIEGGGGGGGTGTGVVDTHSAARLEWLPDFEFADLASLIKPRPVNRDEFRLMEELTFLCMLESQERLAGQPRAHPQAAEARRDAPADRDPHRRARTKPYADPTRWDDELHASGFGGLAAVVCDDLEAPLFDQINEQNF